MSQTHIARMILDFAQTLVTCIIVPGLIGIVASIILFAFERNAPILYSDKWAIGVCAGASVGAVCCVLALVFSMIFSADLDKSVHFLDGVADYPALLVAMVTTLNTDMGVLAGQLVAANVSNPAVATLLSDAASYQSMYTEVISVVTPLSMTFIAASVDYNDAAQALSSEMRIASAVILSVALLLLLVYALLAMPHLLLDITVDLGFWGVSFAVAATMGMVFVLAGVYLALAVATNVVCGDLAANAMSYLDDPVYCFGVASVAPAATCATLHTDLGHIINGSAINQTIAKICAVGPGIDVAVSCPAILAAFDAGAGPLCTDTLTAASTACAFCLIVGVFLFLIRVIIVCGVRSSPYSKVSTGRT